MAESTPLYSLLFQRNLIQLKKKLITAHGNSISIHKGANAKKIREKQIFSKSKIKFLMSIGEENDGKAFFLALSSKRIALFQMKKESPIAIFKLEEKIVDHGTVQVLDMERKKEGEFRVKLIIPIAFHSGTVRKVRLIVHFCDSQITKQKMKCLEEMRIEGEKMRFCVYLGNGNFFGFYEDSVVKSDGLVTRAEEHSTKKKKRIAVVARELWNGNILFATENGTIRVVRAKDDRYKSSDASKLFSEGQCVPPYCTLRCREPSVIISSENTVIVGTQRGEIHFLNGRLELKCNIDTEGGPINCFKVDENDTDFLWVGFESGELRMLFMPDSEHNGDRAEDKLKSPERSDESRALDNEDAKIKSSSWSVKSRSRKLSETYMECQEKGCGYKTFSSTAFLKHLKRTHRTILALAGLVLRCQCGFESISDNHSIMCNTPNLTVVRKHDFGPVRTVADKMIPQCTQCKAYPRTVSGYADHLYRIHSKNLDEIGCCLKCEVCGGVYYTLYSCQEHFKKCKSRFYSLLKLGEEEKKKDETEMDQTADA